MADAMTTYPRRTLNPSRLQPVLCLLFVAAAAPPLLGLIGCSRAVSQDGTCSPVLLLSENFDGVTPPVLSPGWSSTTWVTSNSGVPMPPADTLPNAAFVDDPATISDKQLLSPNRSTLCDAGAVQIFFRNNFNLQDGFDGGVLEVSFDDGQTFQDVL